MLATGKRCVRLGPDGGTPAKHWSAFSPAGIAFTTIVSPIETQLRKVVAELCVDDVPDRVAEVEMSSSNLVRGDPLPDWLQPFAKKERELLHKEKELAQPRLPSRQEVQEHELTHIPYRSWCVHCVRGAGRSDAHRRRARQEEEEREQHMTTWSIDYAFMIDNSDLCTKMEMERVGWDKTRDTVLVSEESVHFLSRQKERSRTTSKNLDTAVRLFVSSRIKNQRLLTSRGQ